MKPFLGLFAQWDVIVRQEPPKAIRNFFRDKSDSEHFISQKLHHQISSALLNPRRSIGGNAGNAAAALSDLGIPCVLSCPSRAKPFMSELAKHKIFLMRKGIETSPLKCARPDEDPEHVIFEMVSRKEADKSGFNRSYRKIFNYDEVQRNFLLDHEFWNSLKNANYLFLSGFHCVPEKRKEKVKEIADFLEKRAFKVHMELGYGEGLMKFAVKKLLDRSCIDSLGMNETELKTLGISGKSPLETKEGMLSFLEKAGLERMHFHTRDYRLSVFRKNPERNLKAAGFSVQACAAKALGGIRENLEKAKSVPHSWIPASKGKNFFIIPARIAENPKIIVGLGDAAAVTDSFFALKGQRQGF